MHASREVIFLTISGYFHVIEVVQVLEAAKAAAAESEQVEAALDAREEKLQQGWAGLHAQAALTGDSGAASLESGPLEQSLQVPRDACSDLLLRMT